MATMMKDETTPYRSTRPIGDAYHEVAGRRRDLHGAPHPYVEGDHLQDPAPYPKKTRDEACGEHDGQPKPRADLKHRREVRSPKSNTIG